MPRRSQIWSIHEVGRQAQASVRDGGGFESDDDFEARAETRELVGQFREVFARIDVHSAGLVSWDDFADYVLFAKVCGHDPLRGLALPSHAPFSLNPL